MKAIQLILQLIRVFGILLYIKLRFFLIDLCEPFQMWGITIKNKFLEPLALLFKLYRKGYGKKPREQTRKLISRWFRFVIFCRRRRNWRMAVKLQETTGIRINPL